MSAPVAGAEPAAAERQSSAYPGSSYIENAENSSSPFSSELFAGGTPPVGSSDFVPHGSSVIPPDIFPVGASGPTKPRTVDDFLAGFAILSDLIGDEFSKGNWLTMMSPAKRAEVQAVIAQLNSPVKAPPADGGGLIVVLGGGLNPDGTVPPAVEMRLEAGLKLAQDRPDAQILMSGGRTPSGHVEAESMKAWFVDHGISAERVIAEPLSWSTVSNAWQTKRIADEVGADYSGGVTVVTNDFHLHRGVVDYTITFGPDVPIYGVEGGSPMEWSKDEQLQKAYRDALVSYFAPFALIADGFTAFGLSKARPF
ncbi:YdcF family protein [Corynebacterium aquatimens]|uniref:YdcF family protein n=1 Tax=Corynebacterium aquatimens TaxID=1190508 RepID=UPI0018C964FD|nr:YdcF family protein [Corynebacterium aquatimens]